MTTYRANPDFMQELKEYGDLDIEACFNCGNCTAVCPLSTESDNFPRRMIRYAQLGLEDELLSSKELWMCLYCGECTKTCPREADPGEYMAAARRFAIAKYDRTGIAKRLYTSAAFNVISLLVLAVVFGVFLYSYHGTMSMGTPIKFFEFIPSPIIHNLGIIAGVIVAITALLGMATMAIDLNKHTDYPEGSKLNWWQALWEAVGVESLGQKSYRSDCETYNPEEKPWYLQKWFAHASVMWGFIGLFVTTAINYLLELLHVKETGTYMAVWHPIRLLGILSGVLLVYGTTELIRRRWKKEDESYTHSTPSDWSFLILMWLAGVTGFALDIAVYLPMAQIWGYWMLLIHLIVIGELLLLAPFTKFAHAVYRIIALYFYALKPVKE